MPGSSLRSPLLWLLVPFMAGIAWADHCPMSGPWIPALTLLATGLGFLGWWLAGRSGSDVFSKGGTRPPAGFSPAGITETRPEAGFHLTMKAIREGWNRATTSLRNYETLANLGWMLAMISTGLLGGYLALHVRSPRLNGAEAAPREVVVVLEAQQLFPPAPGRKTLSGLGRIVATDAHLTELIEQRVYFSAIRRISVTPARSGRYQVRGLLQSRVVAADSESAAGFQRYLESAGIRLTLTRAQLIREEQPPNWFRRFCTRTESQLEKILRQGLERQPAVTSLYLGMLLGEKAALSPAQQNAFMRSGTFHIFSISGLHVGVIAAAILAVLQLLRLSRRAATITGLLILWLYVQVTGASVPAERAFLMIAFLFGSRLFRLPANSLAALVAAALLTLWLDPQQLFSAGFQMSYAVVTALIVMSAPLAERWQAAWKPWRGLPEANWGWLRHRTVWVGREIIGAWAATWVAMIASTPSGIGYFQLFSPGALLANLLIIPLSTFAIIAGFASLLGGLCGLTGLSLIFNHAAAVLILTMDWLVLHGTRLPGVYFSAQFAASWMASAALVLLLTVMFTGASLRWPRRWGAMWWPVLAVTLILFFGVKFG